MSRHPLTSQMELALADNTALADEFSFAHRSFCIAGLPIRRPPPHEGLSANYLRKGNGYDLHLITPNWTVPNSNIVVPIGVPFGPKARLLLIWLASEAQKQGGRSIEISSINSWLRDIGIGLGGRAASLTKEQLVRLCLTMFKITVEQFGENVNYFSQETLVEGGAFDVDSLKAYRDGKMDKIKWPLGIVLTDKAWTRFRRESVPIPKARLREIASSAPAIDIFLYLSYKLPLLQTNETHTVSWHQLGAQFGGSPSRLPTSKIKENLGPALEQVRRAYPEAKMDIGDSGIILHHSGPPELTAPVVSMSGLALPQYTGNTMNA